MVFAGALAVALLLGPLAPASPAGADRAEAAGLIAPKTKCPDHSARGGGRKVAQAKRSMLCLVNHARRRSGLRKYRVTSSLGWSAKKKARDILRCRFSHTACGRQFDFWIKRSGYIGRSGWAVGENIAWGSGSLGNVRSIFVAWMKSPGHRSAILDRVYRDVGVGVSQGTFEGYRGARVWVMHFGNR
jgi:uncharacterized protein YkwD